MPCNLDCRDAKLLQNCLLRSRRQREREAILQPSRSHNSAWVDRSETRQTWNSRFGFKNCKAEHQCDCLKLLSGFWKWVYAVLPTSRDSLSHNGRQCRECRCFLLLESPVCKSFAFAVTTCYSRRKRVSTSAVHVCKSIAFLQCHDTH